MKIVDQSNKIESGEDNILYDQDSKSQQTACQAYEQQKQQKPLQMISESANRVGSDTISTDHQKGAQFYFTGNQSNPTSVVNSLQDSDRNKRIVIGSSQLQPV